MTITNKHNLPQALVDAISNDPYSRGESDISVTQLISPPRLVALKEQHGDVLQEDVSESVYRLMGKAIHTVLERAARDALTEERLFTKVATDLGEWVVSGAFDSLTLDETGDGWRVDDYKMTSIYATKDGARPDWEAQLNLLALLLRQEGFNITSLNIVAMYRDWSKAQSQRSHDYPPVGVEVVPVTLWSSQDTEDYLHMRVRAHQAARQALPECSATERWESPTQYAVMKEGRKSAIRLLDTEDEARDWMRDHDLFHTLETSLLGHFKQGHSIVERPGESKRCANYCIAAQVCDQWKAMKPQETE